MDTYIVTIGFAPVKVLENSWNQVYSTIGLKPKRHILLDHGYPVNKRSNSLMIHKLCQEFDVEYCNLGQNLGLAKGYNWLIDKCKAKSDDMIIGLDPDVYPVSSGWGAALEDVVKADEAVGWASLNVVPHTAREMSERAGKQYKIGEHVVQESAEACLNSICAWRPKMLEMVGGLSEPREYYGGLESHMKPKLNLHRWKWVYLMDKKEEWNDLVKCEDDYAKYKSEYVGGKTKEDFETWLKFN